MLKESHAFSSFSVGDLAKTKTFYGDTLGLNVTEDAMGLKIKLPGGADVFVYQKENHKPATFTILNFVVKNIDQAVDGLTKNGVTFERYDALTNLPDAQDEKGVLRGLKAGMGPDIAWFKDPAGNVVSILQDK